MKPLELSRAGILGTLGVLVVIVVCVRLGFWQLDRREQRLDRNAAIAARMADAPTTLDSAPLDSAGFTYRRVRIRGELDNDRAVALAGRSYNGAPGAHLLTPLRTGQGAVLVNRGWLPAPDAATVDADRVAMGGPVTVEGVLLPFPDVTTDVMQGPGFRETWFRFDADGIRRQLPYPTAPLYLRATAPLDRGGRADTSAFPVPLTPPTLDGGPHLSYAIQWFSFAGIFLLGWIGIVARSVVQRPERNGG